MNYTSMLVATVLILIIMGAIIGPLLARRRRTERLQNTFGTEYSRAVETEGSTWKAQANLEARKKHVEALNIRALTTAQRQRYQADWAAVQAAFVDHPAQASRDADHLIMEVMQLRNYPISDFEQRAADISVQYPELVGNYRAAQRTADRNGQQNVATEELRKSMIYYRSLFDELLKAETIDPANK